MNDRYSKLRSFLSEQGISALLIASRPSMRYYEGYTGADSLLLTNGERAFLITDSRCAENAADECGTAEVLLHDIGDTTVGDVAAAAALKSGWRDVVFESDDITYALHEKLASSYRAAGLSFEPLDLPLNVLRAVKDEGEIALTERACGIADRALERTLPMIARGISELDLKTELEYAMMREGATGISFETIVLFGARTSQPHAASRRDVALREGDFILIDYGAELDGYRSDTTRTFVFGSASDEQRRAYDAVLASQQAALEMVRPGAVPSELTSRAEQIIEDAGFPPFGHSLGHGVGLEIHEQPSLRPSSASVLEPGMIITIEPGSYSPGWGGIRIEDTVLVTDDGARILTHFPKTFTEIR